MTARILALVLLALMAACVSRPPGNAPWFQNQDECGPKGECDTAEQQCVRGWCVYP